jgi:hypothetical protein
MLSKFLRLRVTSKVLLELMGTPEGSPVLMFRPCDDLLGMHCGVSSAGWLRGPGRHFPSPNAEGTSEQPEVRCCRLIAHIQTQDLAR